MRASAAPTAGCSAASSSAHIADAQHPYPMPEAVGDILSSNFYSDGAITQWILRLWHDAAYQRTHDASSVSSQSTSHNQSKQAVMQVAAVRLFGDRAITHDSSAASCRFRIPDAGVLKRRYRQLALRVHPDKNTSADAAAAFQLVQSCFEAAVAAGDDVTRWTWSPRKAETIRSQGGTADAARGESSGFERAASLHSSLFSSSSASSASSSNEKCNRSLSSDDEESAAVSSDEGEAHQGSAFPGAPYRRTCAASASNSAMPEPPTVFFEAAAAGPRDGAFGVEANQVPPPPPPPNVFGVDDDEEGNSGDSLHETPPRSAHGSYHHRESVERRFDKSISAASVRKSRCPVPLPRLDEDTADLPQRNTHAASPIHRQNEDWKPSSSAVPPPPSVFSDPSPSPPSATTKQQNLHPSSPPSGKTASRAHRHRLELPTLAELLARLDAEESDGDANVGSEEVVHSHEDRYVPLARCAGTASASEYFNVQAGHREAGIFCDAVLPRHVPSKKKQRYSGEEGMRDKRKTGDAASPVAPLYSFGATASSFPLSGSEKKRSVAVGGKASTEFPVSSSLPSRRVGGGGGVPKSMNSLGAAGGRSEELRCACGKARRGQCFLCE